MQKNLVKLSYLAQKVLQRGRVPVLQLVDLPSMLTQNNGRKNANFCHSMHLTFPNRVLKTSLYLTEQKRTQLLAPLCVDHKQLYALTFQKSCHFRHNAQTMCKYGVGRQYQKKRSRKNFKSTHYLQICQLLLLSPKISSD